MAGPLDAANLVFITAKVRKTFGFPSGWMNITKVGGTSLVHATEARDKFC